MNSLISASAGSGKTYALTTCYLRLLLQGEPPETILATTFTKKASREIFDRLMSRLAHASLDSNALKTLADDTGLSSLTQQQCQSLLHTLCGGLNRLMVGTLDSFFQTLCLALGQSGKITDAKSPQAVSLRRAALCATLDRLPQDKLCEIMDALHQSKAPYAVIGEFNKLTEHLREMHGDATPAAWEALAIPCPPAQEIVEQALMQLHSLAPTLTNGNWKNALSRNLLAFGDEDWEDFVTKGLVAASLKEEKSFYKKPLSQDLLDLLTPLVSVARTAMLADLQRRTLAARDVIHVYTQEERALCQREGLRFFHETPLLLLPLLGELIDAPSLMGNALNHFLLDEFQDTSHRQWAVLRPFVKQSAHSGHGETYVVGDVKQAIYGWRGGHAEIFEKLELEIPDLLRAGLHTSYRSSQTVLDFVNGVFAGLPACSSLKDYSGACQRWMAHFQPHKSVTKKTGYVEAVELPAGQDAAARWAWSAAYIAKTLSRYPANASVGILTHKNAVAGELTDALRILGVEVSSEGAGEIADDPAVGLILSALIFADHPGHTAALYHVASSPLAGELNLFDDILTNPEAAATAAAQIRRGIMQRGYARQIASWACALAPYGQSRTARRLEQLTDFAAEMDALPPMRISEFVRAAQEHRAENPGAARVRVMTINRAKGLEFDAVFLPELDWKATVMSPFCLTRRGGLQDQYPISAVYRYPSIAARALSDELSEAHSAMLDEDVTGMLCLLYVALTRPRYALHLLVNSSENKISGVTPLEIVRAGLSGEKESCPDGSALLHMAGELSWPKTVFEHAIQVY